MIKVLNLCRLRAPLQTELDRLVAFLPRAFFSGSPPPSRVAPVTTHLTTGAGSTSTVVTVTLSFLRTRPGLAERRPGGKEFAPPGDIPPTDMVLATEKESEAAVGTPPVLVSEESEVFSATS